MTPIAGERSRRLPILAGILPIDTGRVPAEALAGATLAALAIPETMGYASMAQMPIVTGLYTLLIPVFLFAVFGSSRHLVVAADSATAITMAAGLTALGIAGGSPEWVGMMGVAALMVAGVLVLARILRLGFLAYFLSRSVLVGFLTGVGIQVAMGQLAGVLGVPKPHGGSLEQFFETLREIPQADIATVAVAVAVWVVILGSERVSKKIPGALIAVVGMILIGYLGVLPASVSLLGPVPSGLPPVGLPQGMTGQNVLALLPIVLSCFLVVLAQSAATSSAYAMKYRDSFDENVDLIGLAAANVGAGLSGTWMVNGSPTKTEMVDSAGGRTQLAQAAAGIVTLVVLLFLTPALAYMPNAVLAAVVLLIGVKLINVIDLRRIGLVRRGEFAVATVTALTVVVIGVEQAIVLAIALSVVEHISHSYNPYNRLLTTTRDGDYRFETLDTRAEALPGLLIYRFGASLYYANSARFTAEIEKLTQPGADPPVRWLCVDASAMADVDYSGAATIRSLLETLRARGVTLVLCDVDSRVRGLLDAYGLTQEIGAQHFYPVRRALLEAYRGLLDAGQAQGDAPAPA
jgi:sulfate permease, SulP family